jgi:hypothetical protein
MASEVVRRYESDRSESVEVDDACSSCRSVVGRIESSVLSLSSHSSSVLRTRHSASNYCQCTEDDALVKCLTCGLFFELDTECPGC